MNKISHDTDGKNGAFYYEIDGRRMAEMVYAMTSPKLMVIDHTDVDDSLKGQGIGKKLLGALVDYVRVHHIKVIPVCPFANATFKKTKEWQDVLAPIKINHKR